MTGLNGKEVTIQDTGKHDKLVRRQVPNIPALMAVFLLHIKKCCLQPSFTYKECLKLMNNYLSFLRNRFKKLSSKLFKERN